MKKKKLKKTGFVISVILMIMTFILSLLIIKLNILPLHYLVILLIVLVLVVFFLVKVMMVKSYKIWLKLFAIFISIVLTFCMAVGSIYIMKTYNFMDIISKNKIYENYYLVTLSSTEIDLSSITEVGVFKEDNDMYNEALSKLDSNIKYDEYSSIISLKNNLLNGNIDVIFISNAMLEFISSDDNKFESKIKKIHTITVESEFKKPEIKNKDFDITKNTFTIYVSGIDTFGEIASRSRSDVNMLVTVNPKTYEVLLTSIPRDYYVQLHDTSGYKDKLTHAGMYGVDMSMKTLEDLLGIDINYYVRVNFSTLISVVDLIDGIDVYSDLEFTPFTNKDVKIYKGMNHMNGAEALAFARERYAYSSGDRHRVQNQQDVITAIIKKLTTSEKIVTKYTSLLDSVSTSFQTNLTIDDLTKLVNLEIDKFPSWNIYKYSLDGFNSFGYTYSMGEQELYVMEPDYDTVDSAAKYILGMDGQSLSELGL